MPLALALDTTTEYGSAALADENGVREEVLIHAPQGFGQVIFAAIQELTARQNIALADINVFAAASVPGSFTGVRVGFAAVKGLAEVLGRRVATISNLAALAEYGTGNRRATVIDARRGEIFAAVYDENGRAMIADSVLPMERFLAALPDHDMEWISESMAAPEGFRSVNAPRALAGTMARMALRVETFDPAAIEANYVRRSDAEVLWKEM